MLTSRQNPLVKQIRQLHTAKGRKEQNFILLEGTHLLEEACGLNYPLETVCATAEWQEKYPHLWQEAQNKARRYETVSVEVLSALATTVQPDGVIATATRKTQPGAQVNPSGIIVALEVVQDPGNLGAIIRSSAAAGCEGLWLSEAAADSEQPKVLRASAGAWFRLPITRTKNFVEQIIAAQESGVQVIATTGTASQTYWEINYQQPTIILLGNEGAGLSQTLINLADQQVKIPLNNQIESLNVSIAAALILYEAQRQKFYC